jgi:hypothetical protein
MATTSANLAMLRDILSHQQSCGGYPRLPIWSSSKVMIKAEPTHA